MPTQSEITDAYVKHALQLIRVSNGLSADANSRLRTLAIQLRRLFAGSQLSTLGLRDVRALLTEADQLIFDAFDHITDSQTAAVAELVEIEAKWAKKIGKYDRDSSDAAIANAIRNFNVAGNTVQERFDAIQNKLRSDLAQQVRLGISADQTDSEIATRAVGFGRDLRGGVFESASRNVRGTIDATTQAAADEGRRTSMKSNGVNALQWSAKLDARVCPACGERDGKIWTIDGEPINHGIPYAPVPLHNWCRCLLLPLEVPADQLDELPDSNSFDDWLATLGGDEQNDILGHGRADLWRSGKITTNDLIGQNGMTLSLGDLRDTLDN